MSGWVCGSAGSCLMSRHTQPTPGSSAPINQAWWYTQACHPSTREVEAVGSESQIIFCYSEFKACENEQCWAGVVHVSVTPSLQREWEAGRQRSSRPPWDPLHLSQKNSNNKKQNKQTGEGRGLEGRLSSSYEHACSPTTPELDSQYPHGCSEPL